MTNEEFIKKCSTYWPEDCIEHAKKLVAIINNTKDFLELGQMCECDELGECMWCAKALRLEEMIKEIEND